MRLDTFFEKFELFADAPGAVARMRELVLELAIQGRLVAQDPADEPTAAMLERVADTSKTRKRNDEPDAFDLPFQLPENWAWVRLPRVLKKLTDGTHHSPPNGSSGDFMYVTAKNIKTDGVLLDGITYVTKQIHDEIYSRCDPSFGDVLYIKDGATTGIATINQVKQPFSMLSSVALLKPSEAVFNRYLLWAMRSPFYYAETRGAMKGAAITRVTLSVMAASLLPLPPLNEQKRIVAKVDELMALCDRLEAQRQERETRHAALSRASLSRFAEAPTTANLDFLFHKSYTIDLADLRKSILTLAVQGKLVPQDAEDEPAENIVGRNVELSADAPCEIPEQWTWTRLSQLAEINGGFAFKSTAYTDEGTRVVRISDFDEFGFKDHKVVRHPFTPDLQKFTLAECNILMAMTGGTVGKSYFVRAMPEPMVVNQRVATIKVSANTSPSYVDIAIRSEMTQQVIRNAKNSTNDNISMGDIKGFAIPLPPLAEQRRIVAKVDQLMALVDQLETQLAASCAVAVNLLEALVAELTANGP